MTSRARVVSVIFALSGFAVALVSGLGAGNAPMQVVLRALIAMLICQAVGAVAGLMFERVLQEQELRHREANPVPAVPSVAAPQGVIEVDEVVDQSGTTRAPS